MCYLLAIYHRRLPNTRTACISSHKLKNLNRPSNNSIYCTSPKLKLNLAQGEYNMYPIPITTIDQKNRARVCGLYIWGTVVEGNKA